MVHIPNPDSVAKYIDYKPQKLGTAIKTARLLPPQLDVVEIPKTTYSTDLESSTKSQIYPTLKPLKKLSTSLSNLLDDDSTQRYKPSQDSNSTIYIPQHRYNLRPLPNRRLSTDTSALNFSALSSSSTSRLLRQHAKPQSSETHSSELVPQSYFTSGVDTASLISSDVQIAYLSGNLFSEVLVPTPVQPTVRLPEYFTVDNSRAPTPSFADYPLRVDGITIYEPRFDPRSTLLAERSIHNTIHFLQNVKNLNLKDSNIQA